MTKAIATGPDFTHLGKPVDWGDATPIDERFPAVMEMARMNLGIDIELCRWSPDDPLVETYLVWWNRQRSAIRRYVTTQAIPLTKVVISRRTDRSDGIVKCYVRVDRKRTRLEVAS